MLKRLIALKKSSKIDCNDFFTNREHPTLHITFKLIYIYIPLKFPLLKKLVGSSTGWPVFSKGWVISLHVESC